MPDDILQDWSDEDLEKYIEEGFRTSPPSREELIRRLYDAEQRALFLEGYYLESETQSAIAELSMGGVTIH